MEQCQARFLDIVRTSVNAEDEQEGLAPPRKALISEVTHEMTYTAMEIKLEEDRMKFYNEVDEYIDTMLMVTRAAAEMRDQEVKTELTFEMNAPGPVRFPEIIELVERMFELASIHTFDSQREREGETWEWQETLKVANKLRLVNRRYNQIFRKYTFRKVTLGRVEKEYSGGVMPDISRDLLQREVRDLTMVLSPGDHMHGYLFASFGWMGRLRTLKMQGRRNRIEEALQHVPFRMLPELRVVSMEVSGPLRKFGAVKEARGLKELHIRYGDIRPREGTVAARGAIVVELMEQLESLAILDKYNDPWDGCSAGGLLKHVQVGVPFYPRLRKLALQEVHDWGKLKQVLRLLPMVIALTVRYVHLHLAWQGDATILPRLECLEAENEVVRWFAEGRPLKMITILPDTLPTPRIAVNQLPSNLKSLGFTPTTKDHMMFNMMDILGLG
ncbi:hypothetical protein JAAARDRAFT_201377 [Jaapia argillacea MUCL 33604]|uniref:Uncharacterized protein n=1 Tax=Jaapia argillacea MUCL 33604 TaxID=933084 RepID=A0A067P282_9AGAM|nr:hypothetical protein JAAARDRAFT_201377 [Jaapia argillacea MUCL 33604]